MSGLAPVLATLSREQLALAAMHADTPIVLWPAGDKGHLDWWRLCRLLPPAGCRVESDLLANERRFTTSSADVHGTLFDGGEGQMLLLLAAEKAQSAPVTVTLGPQSGKGWTVRAAEGQPAPAGGGDGFQAGTFTAGQVKAFHIAAGAKEGAE